MESNLIKVSDITGTWFTQCSCGWTNRHTRRVPIYTVKSDGTYEDVMAVNAWFSERVRSYTEFGLSTMSINDDLVDMVVQANRYKREAQPTDPAEETMLTALSRSFDPVLSDDRGQRVTKDYLFKTGWLMDLKTKTMFPRHPRLKAKDTKFERMRAVLHRVNKEGTPITKTTDGWYIDLLG